MIDLNEAVTGIAAKPQGKFLGGGTNLIDLMKMGVETPDVLIDINRVSLTQIEELPDKGVRVGAMVRNSDLAEHALIRSRYPVFSEALLSGASPQLRNMLLSVAIFCSERAAIISRIPRSQHATNESPAAVAARLTVTIGFTPSSARASNALPLIRAICAWHWPRSMRSSACVVRKANGKSFADFHRLPGNTPQRDSNLEHDELIEYVDLPAIPFATRSDYVKVRDCASYAFALVSVAAALDLDSSKKIKAARIALGGVAHKPWRANTAEKKLIGQTVDEKTFRDAAEAELAAAKGYKHNSFKIELAKRDCSGADHSWRDRMMTVQIGKPLARVDGRLKVTGAATYAAEFQRPQLAYGVLIQSAIANGHVVKTDLSAAKSAPGVMEILTRENTPGFKPYPDDLTKKGAPAKTGCHCKTTKFIRWSTSRGGGR